MTYQPENLERWSRPDYWFAMDDGWQYSSKCFVFLSRHRDSCLIDQSNFACALQALGGESATVKVVTESHWAVGWIEWIAIHEGDAKALQEADSIMAALADYPLLDEDNYSELEHNAVAEYWESCGISERIDLCRDAGLSIFAARRDYLPDDPNGYLWDILRETVNN